MGGAACVVRRMVPSRLQPDAEDATAAAVEPPEEDGQTGGWYVITGGLSRASLQAASALVKHRGARQLVLLTGSAADAVAPEDAAEWEKLRAAEGVTVRVEACDERDVSATAALLTSLGRVVGVVHCAAPAADSASDASSSLHAAWAATAQGALALHQLSMSHLPSLRLFLLYGTAASAVATGPIGPASAGAVLDSLALVRRQMGLPAVCVQWGAWAGSNHGHEAEQLGFLPVTPALADTVLACLLRRDPASLPAVVCCLPIDRVLCSRSAPRRLLDVDLSRLLTCETEAPLEGGEEDLTDEMRAYAAIEGQDERREAVQALILGEVLEVSGLVVKPDDDLFQSGLTSDQVRGPRAWHVAAGLSHSTPQHVRRAEW